MDYTFDIEHNKVVIINTNTKVVLTTHQKEWARCGLQETKTILILY